MSDFPMATSRADVPLSNSMHVEAALNTRALVERERLQVVLSAATKIADQISGATQEYDDIEHAMQRVEALADALRAVLAQAKESQ